MPGPIIPISPVANGAFDDDEDGWQDMPVVREDEFAGGLDEEDQKKYHYQPSAKGPRAANATGNLIDVDDYGNEWRSKVDLNESEYTRLRGFEEDDVDEVHLRTRYLFDEDKAMTPLSQMQATKNLLTEAQRIAYVGLCYITCRDMSRTLSNARRKELKPAVSNMDLWVLKIMGRLYYHMEIANQEQKMIESLVEHGVLASDLVPSLMTTHTVANPEYDPAEAHRQAEERDRVAHIEEDDAESISGQTLVNETLEDVTSTPKANSSQLPKPSHSPSASLSESKSSPKVAAPYQTTARVLENTTTSVPGVTTALSTADQNVTLDIRWTVLCDLFLVLIADSVYDARSRVLLEAVAVKLGLGWLDLVKFESRVTEALEIQEDVETMEQKDLIEGQQKLNRKKRYVMLGLATIGGGLVIGLSAGLLAPVIGAGLGAALTTIGVTGSTAFLGGVAGTAVITTGGVLTGSSIAARGMAKRTKLVGTFDILPLHNNKRVSCILTIPGFMTGPQDDVRLPFSVLDPVVGDVFSVLWEPEMIQETGDALKILTSEVLSQIGMTVLQATVMSAFVAALQWPIILTKLGYLIDNPWSNALDRARAAGRVLADVLLHRNLGVRPITLIGFSLGARVIFYALLELAKHKAFGIVQDVFMLGATVTASTKSWLEVRSVVSGRLVNAYAKNDWVLNYLFRATSGGVGTVAGLRPIENIPGIENVEVTDKIAGHMSYRTFMPLILDQLGFPVSADYFDEPVEPDFEGDRVVVTEEETKEKKSWFSRKKTKPSQNASRPPSSTNSSISKKSRTSTPSNDDDDLPPRMNSLDLTTSTSSSSSSPPVSAPNGNPDVTASDETADDTPQLPSRAGFDLKAIREALAQEAKPEELKFSSAPVAPGVVGILPPPVERAGSAPITQRGHHQRHTNAIAGPSSNGSNNNNNGRAQQQRENVSTRLQRALSLEDVTNHGYDDSDRERERAGDFGIGVGSENKKRVQMIPLDSGLSTTPFTSSMSTSPNNPFAVRSRPFPSPPSNPFVSSSSSPPPPLPLSLPSWGALTESIPVFPTPGAAPASASGSGSRGFNFPTSSMNGDALSSSGPDFGLSFGGADGSIVTGSRVASSSTGNGNGGTPVDLWKIPSRVGAGKKNAVSPPGWQSDNPWS